MILVTHSLVGAVIGKNISNPGVIIAASIASHFILDALHHGEYLDKNSTFKNTAWKVALDLFAGFFLITLYVYFGSFGAEKIRNIFVGVIASLFPDFLTFIFWTFKFKFLEKIYEFHERIHKLNPLHSKNSWTFKNARNDILISIAAIVLLLL